MRVHTRLGGHLPAMLMIGVCIIGSACGGSDADCRVVEFTLTPVTSEGAGTPFVVAPTACTHPPTGGDCNLEVFDMPGDQYFQYGGTDDICFGIFEATIEHEGNVYFLNGQVQREFGTGTGPFATGTYTNVVTQEGGNFSFNELGFKES